jgi:hypothetical protein
MSSLSMNLLKNSSSSGHSSNMSLDEVAHVFFGERHVVEEIVEGHLGLDHPELGGVAGGVAVLGAEGGAEGVDVAERTGEGLALELAADGEVGGAAKEVLLASSACPASAW